MPNSKVILRRTELRAELEALLEEYTEGYPKVADANFELTALDKSLARLAAVKPGEAHKLTSALGKLIVRKAELETELWNLQKQYSDTHPSVKRARKRVDIFEQAVTAILN